MVFRPFSRRPTPIATPWTPNTISAETGPRKSGYQGSSSRHYTRQNNLELSVRTYQPDHPEPVLLHERYQSNYNALLAEIEHRFAKSFQIDAQYRWSKTIDEGSNDYFIGEYPYGLQYLRGPADFDVRHLFKLYGEYSPRFFKDKSWKEKVLGGWQVTGIFNYHTGFPWTPLYSNTGCNVVYQNSGYCNLRPAAYLGGAGTDYSNSTFERPSGNFPSGALAYFTVPTFPASGTPPAPSVGRNVLVGPNFLNLDATLTKAFGIPSLKIFGEAARFEFRANFFNLLNRTNLSPLTANSVDQMISTDGRTSNPLFGQPQSALGGRTIEFQARFSF